MTENDRRFDLIGNAFGSDGLAASYASNHLCFNLIVWVKPSKLHGKTYDLCSSRSMIQRLFSLYIVCPHSLLFNVWFIVHDDS